ncbi:MAG: hypothetical protein EZS28_054679, partial [Streblomastix strix]
PRIYLLGIYLNIHVHALGIELPPAVEAQAKYGDLYLEPVHGVGMQADEQKVQYHLLVLANISSTEADKERTEQIEADLDDDLQKTYYHQIFLFKQKDGSMTKATDNDEDPKDINMMKHGIINSIRTYVSEKESREERMMIMNTKRSHSEYFKTEQVGY